ncbi:MAG: hypothetical protein WC408_04665 [Candidatus Micrarchaeia archaeon]|jgi:hypothetical protein
MVLERVRKLIRPPIPELQSENIHKKMNATAGVTHATIEELQEKFPGYSIGVGATSYPTGDYDNLVRVLSYEKNKRAFTEENSSKTTQEMPTRGWFEIYPKTPNKNSEPDALIRIGNDRSVIFVRKKNELHEQIAKNIKKEGRYILAPEIRTVGLDVSLSALQAADNRFRRGKKPT